MIPSPFNPVQRGKVISVSQLEQLAKSLQALHGAEGTNELQYDTGATGHQIVDQSMHPVLAIIGLESGSGLGSGSSPMPANDQYNVYEGVEGTWTVEDNDFTVIEKSGGLRFKADGVPLIEANGTESVPTGSVVMAYPAYALGYHFYYFFWSGDGESGSSGGNHQTYYGTCPDGDSFFYVQINGTSITVGEATHG